MVDDYLGIVKCGEDSVDLNIFFNTQIEMKKLEFHISVLFFVFLIAKFTFDLCICVTQDPNSNLIFVFL